MKNLLSFLSLLLISILSTSCSQNQSLTSQKSQEADYAYHRVYEGNKVVFRNLGVEKNQEPLALENLKEILEESEDEAAPGFSEKNTEEPQNIRQNKREWHPRSLGNRFAKNLKSIHQSGMAGHFLTKSFNLPKEQEKSLEDDASSISNGQVFALIGFIFGLLSFLGSFWIAGAVVGIVFSILGWDSDWHIFALLGLIFSVAGIVLYALLRI